ncbi:hypothetical protein [Bacillus sp. UMB0728]|uniref:hypothetical protein n=1 Tax=Bacillus sp. UMB0728 TaxID=2066052 RepID=UPI001157967E|nr:hypothetical protein [Bacillus sp. UMB0728]
MKELEKFLNQTIQDSLKTDVSKKIVKVAEDRVQKDVYNVYTPKEYTRSGELKKSFEVKEIPNGIEIENTRKDGNREIDEIIEYGHDKSAQGYEYPAYYPGGDNFTQPRPFIENTRQQILNENIHADELRKSLNKKGLDVK